MKYCSKCGIRLDDNASFCIECGGAAAGVADNPAPDYSSVPLINRQVGILNTIRDLARSKLFLATIIVYAVTALLNLAYSFYSITEVEPLSDYTSATIVGEVIGIIISAAPTVLILIGMWITYSSAKSADERLKTNGLNIIRIITIIMLVLICIVVAFAIPLSILVVFLSGSEELMFDPSYWGESMAALFSEFMTVFLVVALVVALIVAVLMIVYYSLVIKTIKSIKTTIETGVLTGKVSIFVAVMSIIIGVFTALSAFSSITGNAIFAGIASLPSAASYILFGVIIFNYDSRVKTAANI
ncbi:MAG: zinc ribbon domain-containing protein [Clostridia bacterium]|nr:zinc ribbon domain-containing protein [Clostridia bacterium]